MSRSSLLCGLLCVFGPSPGVEAANRFFFLNQTVPKSAHDIGIFLCADVDQPLYGFSFGIRYDKNALSVKDVTFEGTVIPATAPDFFNGIIDGARGLVGYGCVLDFGPPFGDALAPGSEERIARLVVDVMGNAGTSSQISPETVSTNPDLARPVKNVMTNNVGVSILPALAPGTITIEDRAPQIQQITGNTGDSGTVFQVTGLLFGEPGRSVKVGGVVADATLRGDGLTLDVTAPTCSAPGFKLLEICTIYGCDSEANGFNCFAGQAGGRQKPGDMNQDGKLDLSDAVALLDHLFVGTPRFQKLPCEGETAPSPGPGERSLLDANHDGEINLSDSIVVLSFLFSGGPKPFLCIDDSCGCIEVEGCPDNANCP